MYKICENCKEKYDLKEKKCPQCGGKLKKQYTEEELKEYQILCDFVNLWKKEGMSYSSKYGYNRCLYLEVAD